MGKGARSRGSAMVMDIEFLINLVGYQVVANLTKYHAAPKLHGDTANLDSIPKQP